MQPSILTKSRAIPDADWERLSSQQQREIRPKNLRTTRSTSYPITSKGNETTAFATSQGARKTQEDCVGIQYPLNAELLASITEEQWVIIMKEAVKNMVTELDDYSKQVVENLATSTDICSEERTAWKQALNFGSTFATALRINDKIIVATAGDSNFVAAITDESGKTTVIPLGYEHKASDESEQKRVTLQDHATITIDSEHGITRLNECLCITRGLTFDSSRLSPPTQTDQQITELATDSEVPKQTNKHILRGFSSIPDVFIYTIKADPKIKIRFIGECDGITDVMNCHDLAILISQLLKDQSFTAHDAATKIVKEALKKGSRDNCTVLVSEANSILGIIADGFGLANAPEFMKRKKEESSNFVAEYAAQEFSRCLSKAICNVLKIEYKELFTSSPNPRQKYLFETFINEELAPTEPDERSDAEVISASSNDEYNEELFSCERLDPKDRPFIQPSPATTNTGAKKPHRHASPISKKADKTDEDGYQADSELEVGPTPRKRRAPTSTSNAKTSRMFRHDETRNPVVDSSASSECKHSP